MKMDKETYIGPEETPIIKYTLMWVTETLGQMLDQEREAIENGDLKKALEINGSIRAEGDELYNEVHKLVRFCKPPWNGNYWEW